MKEEFKDVEGFEDYLVSNFGYIISKERFTDNGKTALALKKEKILKTRFEKKYDGYVQLYKNSKARNFKVKELVAKHFIELPTEYPLNFYEIYFKDGDITNCKASNLYYEINNLAIRLFDLEGNWLGDYPNAVEIASIYNMYSGNFYQAASGGVRSTGPFQCRFLKTYGGSLTTIKSLPSTIETMRSNTAPIAKYWNDKLICVYNSVTEAAINNILSVTEIWSSRDREKSVNGFLFKKI